jgi:hypothetical protein
MTDEEAELVEARAAEEHRQKLLGEARQHSDEYESLPLIIVCTIPLLIFGSVLMSMFGLMSKWWYLVLIGVPWLGFYLYPLLLLDRLKTPLRLPGGTLLTGKARRRQLIIAGIVISLWLFRFEIFALLEHLYERQRGLW